MTEDAKFDYDETDVETALARTTHDGPGFDDEDELPPSDFVSFATDEVEGESQ